MRRKRRRASSDRFTTTILKKVGGRWKMISSLERSVHAVVKNYRMNPGAMGKALTELLKTELERSARENEKEMAMRKCLKAHPAGCDHVGCLRCAQLGAYVEAEDDGPM